MSGAGGVDGSAVPGRSAPGHPGAFPGSGDSGSPAASRGPGGAGAPGAHGPRGEPARAALLPFSLLWGAVASSRNFLYDHGIARIHRLDVPVVSVGNITAGGTGKTPLVILLARRLIEAGLRPLVLSRGYGSRGTGTRIVANLERVLLGPDLAGDEPALIAASVPGLPVVVDPDRARGGREAVRLFEPSVVLLDDGFQHRRLARALDIVVLDATDPFGRGRMIPSGLLREPLRGLGRAGLFVVTRSQAGASAGTVEAVVRRYNPRAPILIARHEPEALIPVGGWDAPAGGAGAPRHLPLDVLRGAPVHAFCGIGNPGAFRATLEEAGAVIGRFEAFRDHHVYATGELERLAGRARDAEARLLLTTEKDAIRISRAPSAAPIHALRIRMQVQAEERLLAPVLSLAGRR